MVTLPVAPEMVLTEPQLDAYYEEMSFREQEQLPCISADVWLSMRPKVVADSRPRHEFRLPSGEIVRVIFDHEETIPHSLPFQLKGGQIVTAIRVPEVCPF